jgi:hypothetical protein
MVLLCSVPRPVPPAASLLLDIAVEGECCLGCRESLTTLCPVSGLLEKRADTRLFHPFQQRYVVLLLGQIRELRYYHRVMESRFGNIPMGASTSIPLESIREIVIPAREPAGGFTFLLHTGRLEHTSFPRSAARGIVLDGKAPGELSEEVAVRMRRGGAVEPPAATDRSSPPLGLVNGVSRVFSFRAKRLDDRARWVRALRAACGSQLIGPPASPRGSPR